jgi:alpha-galactosidase/6-phospho-beta-glucosidase family protein
MEHYRAVIKVAFVGAGSVEFTRNVVTDLCSFPEFNDSLHLTLYDINAERLAHARRLAERIAARTVAMCDELFAAHAGLLPAFAD